MQPKGNEVSDKKHQPKGSNRRLLVQGSINPSRSSQRKAEAEKRGEKGGKRKGIGNQKRKKEGNKDKICKTAVPLEDGWKRGRKKRRFVQDMHLSRFQ